VDGDGDLDVLSASYFDDMIAWYEHVSSLNGTPTFVEGGPAVVLDADVDVSDAELDAFNAGNGNYHGASVTLVRNGGAAGEDVFSFNDGNGITLVGADLIKNSQIIASFDTTSTPGQLVVTFTDANGEIPTSVDVDNILRQITYSNSSDTPPASAQIDWTFDDGNAGAQGPGGALQAFGSTKVSITAVNDAPGVTAPGAIGVTEDAVSIIKGSGISFSDVDAGGASVVATFTVAQGTLAASPSAGVTIGGTPTALTLTGSTTAINNLISPLFHLAISASV
jgi:hypothetical protein